MLTEQEYKRLRDLYDRKYEWVKEQGYSYLSGGEPEEFREITNEITSQIEVYEWINNPPEEYFAYVREYNRTINTWMGDELGSYRVTGTHREPVEMGFIDEEGNEKVKKILQRVKDLYVIGTNGVNYIGKYYYQNGDYCTLERVGGGD